jgi:DNA (cytosine-5)-methyltransferase 1
MVAALRCVSIFAGIGGFDAGFGQAGIETVAIVEIDKNCRKLMAAKFPNAQQFDDARTVGKNNLPPCDIVCGGFPCQDLSVAGKRAGLAGNRSGLFYELTRITHELQPAFLVWENVPGLLSSNRGHDFLAVLTELRRIGYSGGWRTFDAQYFGVAQRRRRIFGVFARRDIGADRCAEILSLAEGVRGHPAPGREARERPAGTLNARTKGGGGLGTDFELGGGLTCDRQP